MTGGGWTQPGCIPLVPNADETYPFPPGRIPGFSLERARVSGLVNDIFATYSLKKFLKSDRESWTDIRFRGFRKVKMGAQDESGSGC